MPDSRPDGVHMQGSRPDGAHRQGSRPDGVHMQGSRPDGVYRQGSRADSVRSFALRCDSLSSSQSVLAEPETDTASMSTTSGTSGNPNVASVDAMSISSLWGLSAC